MLVTYSDVYDYVVMALQAGEGSADFDIDAIVRELDWTFGVIGHDTSLTHLDIIDPDVFWAIVAKHDTTV
jgi:hypothetical protein